MKFGNIKAVFVISTLLLTSSCSDFDDLVKNPNQPTSVPSSLLLTGVQNTMGEDLAWTSAQIFNQYHLSTYTYYGSNNYDQSPFLGTGSSISYYLTLENAVRMETEAKNQGAADVNPYAALSRFFKAYYLNLMSQKFGDLPVKDALTGSESPTPVYDTQKSLYIQVLQWLDESNTMLSQLIAQGDVSLAGDIYLNNDLKAWQKVVNSFTLRVLVSLSNQADDADLKVKDKFAAIVSDASKYPVLTSIDDNLQYKYNASYNPYPKNPGNYKQTNTRENISATILNLTTSLQDPRTFIVATPAPAQLSAGKTISDFNAYVGANPGDDMTTLGNNSQAGVYSFENALRYTTTFDGANCEPAMIIGYPELCFNVAEGINLGWGKGSAADWYEKGIRGSMEHFGIEDGKEITVGDNAQNVLGTVTVSVTNYLAQSSVKYKGDNTDGRTQILNQKYIAFWENSNWEAFFNARRTGVPAFLTGPGTGNSQKVPLRWQYPASEAAANSANYTKAITDQYKGVDDLNGKMWILQ